MELYKSEVFTPRNSFTDGIEGPACDGNGYLYAVNYEREHTIGRVSPDGQAEVFVELPGGSNGSGIRFGHDSTMYVADYTGHNILTVDMKTREVKVLAHEDTLCQPNDIAVTKTGIIFASDPDWDHGCGALYRVKDGLFQLLEKNMGTTNGVEVSPDQKRLYVNETFEARIWVYDLHEDGTISNKRLFAEFSEGWLDGMRCDVKGNLYAVRSRMGLVVVLSPEGELLHTVSLHGKDCTNVTFGAPGENVCYVTVADNGNVERFFTDNPGPEL